VLEFSLSDRCDKYDGSLCGEFREVSMHVYTDTGVTEYPPNGIAVRTWFEGQGIEGAEHEFGMTRNQIYYENADDSLKGFRLMRTPSVGMFFEDSGAKLSGTRVHDFDGPRISSDAS